MIQINILVHNSDRFIFTKKSLNYLMGIKDCNKLKIKINISYSDIKQKTFWEELIDEFKLSGFFISLSFYPYTNKNNYLNKINSFLETACEYSCSMDDDIMLSTELWDYMIDNINILDDEDNLFLAPIISNGIPSIELFINDFCDEDFTEKMHNLFINTNIPNLWGANYEHLNVDRDVWDMDYFESVKKINHHYKGIHPIRISVTGQEMVANYVCDNFDNFLSKNDYYLEKFKYPYFCNSFYFIKTSVWKKIIEDKSLFRDPYDEVPLNIYRESNDLNMVFVRNGFCLHMAYNTIGPDEQKRIEDIYKKRLLK